MHGTIWCQNMALPNRIELNVSCDINSVQIETDLPGTFIPFIRIWVVRVVIGPDLASHVQYFSREITLFC